MGKPAGLDLPTLQALRAPSRDLTLLVDRIAGHLDAHDGYVALSGGKDSTVVLDLARRADPNVPVCFFDSGLEFPETLAYIDELTDRWNLNLHVIPTRPTALEYLQANGSWTHQPVPARVTAAAGTMHQVLITEPAGQAHQRHGDGELWGIRAQESRGRRIMLLKALADAISAPGEKLEDVFKSVRRQVRLTTAEAQIPWESTALDRDFYFVPALPPPTAAAQLLAAAKETGNVALFDLLIERFPDSPEVKEATLISTKLRAAEASAPANAASSAALVLARARETRTPQAYDLVASLFPETPAAEEARTAAARLREVIVLDSAGPTYEGRDLVLQIQAQLERLGCLTGDASGAFDAVTIQGLRRATLLSDERYLWYRPTMAALRVLKKIDAANGCARETIVAAPRCLHINAEDFCP